jgi:hypothetical protein
MPSAGAEIREISTLRIHSGVYFRAPGPVWRCLARDTRLSEVACWAIDGCVP